MRSRTSFFDIRFARHLLRRFWPLWLLWLTFLLLAGPLGLSNNYGYEEPVRLVSELRQDLLSSGMGVVWLSALMGALMAMGMLSYLYLPRDCALVSSLPLRRETVYFTAVLTGLLPMLLCDVLAFLLLRIFYRGYGVEPRYFFWWLEMVLLANTGFYGFACFCGTLTGNILVLPAVYMVLNLAVALYEAAVRQVFHVLLYGYSYDSLLLERLSPLVWLTEQAEYKVVTDMDLEHGIAAAFEPTYLSYLACLCAAGLVFVLLGALILRRRHMESAGEVVAVPVLRPVFRVCMALGCGLLGSAVTTEEFLPALCGTAEFAALAVSMCVFAALGWFIAEMLIKKTLRVFDHGWLEIGLICVCLLSFAALTELDVTGYETRVPAAEEIASIDMPYMLDGGLAEQESIAAVLDLHRALIAHKGQNEPLESGPVYSFPLVYRLRDGSVFRRFYLLPEDEASRADPGSDIALWERINNMDEPRLKRVWAKRPLTADEIRDAWVEIRETGDDRRAIRNELALTPEQAVSLHREGIVPDAEAGRIARWTILDEPGPEDGLTGLTVVICRRITRGDDFYIDYLNTDVLYESENTLRWLRENLGLAPED